MPAVASDDVEILDCRLLPDGAATGSERGAWCVVSVENGLAAVVQYLLKDGLLLPAEIHVTPQGEWASLPGPNGPTSLDSVESLRRKTEAMPPVGIGKMLLEGLPIQRIDEVSWAAIAAKAKPGTPLREAAEAGRTRWGRRPSPDQLLLARAEDYIAIHSQEPIPDKPIVLLAKKWGVGLQRARSDLRLARKRRILVGYDAEATLGVRGDDLTSVDDD